MASSKKCPIRECNATILSEHVMCREHWRMVDLRLRGRVYGTAAHARTGRSFQRACNEAIESVEVKLALQR